MDVLTQVINYVLHQRYERCGLPVISVLVVFVKSCPISNKMFIMMQNEIVIFNMAFVDVNNRIL